MRDKLTTPRNSLPRLCLLCPIPLSADTRPEHPILDSIGGRLKSRELFCNTCNERLGGEIDSPLAKAVETFRYLLRIRAGDGADPPTLRQVQTEHGPMDFGPTRVVMSKVPRLERPRANVEGVLEATITGRSVDEAARMTAHAARMTGIKSREHLVAALQVSGNMAVQPQPFTKPIELNLNLAGVAQMRSIAKAALGVFAMAEPDSARSRDLDDFRRFVSAGDHAEERARWTINPLPPLGFTNAELGDFPHVVAVWAHNRGPLVARVTLFGYLHFAVRMADTWPTSLGIAHALDPLEGRNLDIRRLSPLPPALDLALFKPEQYQPEVVNAYFTDFIQRCRSIEPQRHRKGLVREVMAGWYEKHRGTELTPEKANELAQAVAMKVTGFELGLGEPIDRDDFVNRVLDWFDRLAAEDDE